MNTTQDQILVKDLTFSYKPSSGFVIKDFSCVIPLGSRVVILGLNGTGKTTLLNLLLGISKPLKGSIKLTQSNEPIDFVNLNGAIGYLPQLENIPFDYRVNEYVMLGRLPYIPMFSVPTEIDRNIVAHVLESLKMPDFFDKRLREISGGELQRIRLARILAQEPEIILMDEPATHLDIKNKRSLYQLINELSGQGKTIIYSSHDPLGIADTSDYCILMSKSKKTQLMDTQNLLKTDILSEYFETDLGFNEKKI